MGRFDMPDIRIDATGGGEFDCYISLPESGPDPALVIMSTIFGVDGDIRRMADDVAARGCVAAAPDLFWRGDAGPMPRTEDGMRRARERATGRDDLIEFGVQDLADVMAELKRLPECNGRIAVVGLCYGGPFALLGPARLGCDAGLSFHGTAVENHLHELANIGAAPIRLHWGDADRVCPPDTLARIRAATDGMANVELTIYPGVVHGYTAASNAKSWNAAAAEDSWAGALAVLDGLRDAPQAAAQA
jgi:carboxymethylenebutenolidase